jgi:hypothetical protein
MLEVMEVPRILQPTKIRSKWKALLSEKGFKSHQIIRCKLKKALEVQNTKQKTSKSKTKLVQSGGGILILSGSHAPRGSCGPLKKDLKTIENDSIVINKSSLMN